MARTQSTIARSNDIKRELVGPSTKLVTETTSLGPADKYVHIHGQGSGITLTLANPSEMTGQMVFITYVSGTGTVTLAGGLTNTLTDAGTHYMVLVSDGYAWRQLSLAAGVAS